MSHSGELSSSFFFLFLNFISIILFFIQQVVIIFFAVMVDHNVFSLPLSWSRHSPALKWEASLRGNSLETVLGFGKDVSPVMSFS